MMRKLARACRKLRHMTPAEITGRAAGAALQAREALCYRIGRRGGAEALKGPFVGAAARTLLQNASRFVLGASTLEYNKLRDTQPESAAQLHEAVVRRARELLAGRLSRLGHTYEISGRVDWHRDPVSGYRWPRRFYAGVPIYELPGGVDVKHVWELNRHQFLVDLAAAWVIDRREECAQRVRDLLVDWIAQNPLYEGVNWTSALEAGMRVISWMWSAAMLGDWPGWSDNDLQLLGVGLASHGRYLAAHLSFHSSPYNHLMGEAAGLYLLGCWLDGIPMARKWRALGRKVLIDHGPRQFHSDGFCVEQASGYHFFTLGFLSIALCVARACQDNLGPLASCMSMAWRAGAQFAMPDGRWPALGDVDSARALPVSPDDYWDFRGLCSLGAVLHSLPELKAAAQRPGAELFWLLGSPGVKAFEQMPAVPLPAAAFLPESGFCLARAGRRGHEDWLLFDCGPVAHGLHADATPSVAHGHLDQLQVLCCRDGQPLLVDAGMPTYAGLLSSLEHFRGSAAHNVFEIEGLPAARHGGRLAWQHVVAKPVLDACLCGETWVLRGVLRLANGATLERHILRLPRGEVWLADVARGSARRARWHWQFPAAECVALAEQSPHHARLLLSRCEMAFDCGAAQLQCSVKRGQQGSLEGWRSLEYGEMHPATSVELTVGGAGTLTLLTRLGEVSVPVAVEIGNLRLLSQPALPLDVPWLDGAAEVAWHAWQRDHWLTVACGRGADALDDTWTVLEGAGTWRCRARVARVARPFPAREALNSRSV
jgi:hypothetical protein